jgi:hypothetical protein
MEFKCRKIDDKYTDVTIIIDNTTHELGLFDYHERKILLTELWDAINSLDYENDYCGNGND